MGHLRVAAALALMASAFFGGLVVGHKVTKNPDCPPAVTDTKNVVTTVKEVVNKDGTKTIETVVVDKSVVITKKETPKKYKAGVTVGYSLTDKKPVYGLNAERQLTESLAVGISVDTQKTVGLGLSIRF